MDGVVIIDTGPTMDFFTKSALLASDVVLIPIKDIPSLDNTKSIVDFIKESNRDTQVVRLVPSIIDGRVKLKNNDTSMDTFLRSVALEMGYDLLKTSIPKSPKVEALTASRSFKVYSILTHAKGTLAHKRFVSLAREVLLILDNIKEPVSLSLLKELRSARRYQTLKKNLEPAKKLPHKDSFSYLKGKTDKLSPARKKTISPKPASHIAGQRHNKTSNKKNDRSPSNYLWKLSRNLKRIFRMS